MFLEFSEADLNDYELLMEAMDAAPCVGFEDPVERRESTEEDWDISF